MSNLEISSKRSYMKRLIMKSIILYKNLASWLKLIYTKNINPIKQGEKDVRSKMDQRTIKCNN